MYFHMVSVCSCVCVRFDAVSHWTHTLNIQRQWRRKWKTNEVVSNSCSTATANSTIYIRYVHTLCNKATQAIIAIITNLWWKTKKNADFYFFRFQYVMVCRSLFVFCFFAWLHNKQTVEWICVIKLNVYEHSIQILSFSFTWLMTATAKSIKRREWHIVENCIVLDLVQMSMQFSIRF